MFWAILGCEKKLFFMTIFYSICIVNYYSVGTKCSDSLPVKQRNRAFVKNSNFLIPISLQPDSVNL